MKRFLACILTVILICATPLTASASAGPVYSFSGTCYDMGRGRNNNSYNVKKLQQALKNCGYLSGSVDGVYGKQTKAAVAEFQRKNGVHGVSGYSGIATTFTQALLYGDSTFSAWIKYKRSTSYYGNYSVYNYDMSRRYGNTGTMRLKVKNDSYGTVSAVRLIYWLEDSNYNHVNLGGYYSWDTYKYNLYLKHGDSVEFSVDFTPYSSEWNKARKLCCIVAEIAYSSGEVYVNYNPDADLTTLSAYRTYI